MNYKFDVMVALTYEDKDIEVEIDLSDEQLASAAAGSCHQGGGLCLTDREEWIGF